MPEMPTSRRRFLRSTALGGAAALARAPGAVAAPRLLEPKRPNFLFVLCDQLGLDAIAAHGCPDVATPHLDRIVSQGTTFLESHSTNPVCSPARSSLMTGRMPVETGVISNSRPIHPDCRTVGHVLRQAGYQTLYCGKWHLPGGVPRPEDGFHVLPARGGRGTWTTWPSREPAKPT